MTPQDVKSSLEAVGLSLDVGARGQLIVRGPRAAYSAELRSAVDMHKEALLRSVAAGVAGFAGLEPYNAGARGDDKTSLSENFSAFPNRASPAKPATPASDTAPLAHTEIASLPIALTRDLPAPTTLVVRLQGRQAPSVFTSSAARAESERRLPRGEQRAVWAIGEVELAAYAVQEGRAFARDLAEWDSRKLASRGGWALTPQQAIGGAVMLLQGGRPGGWIPEGALTLTWGQLLRRIDAELVEVICEDVPAARTGAESSEGDEVML